MKVFATITNTRRGRKGSGDDSRLLIELTYKNKIVGTLGLYPIVNDGGDVGYRVVYNRRNHGGMGTVIDEEVTRGETLQSKRGHMDECNGDDISCSLHTKH